ncbi:hypothetical protein IFJ82_03040 [Novacetimonas hansenii]|uniref:Uncharacterized protein n=2 Tax=Novacetimonas hansenii TaxID=436 RepID=A0AAW5ETG3_NOVHA|nr:hypothetical protein [Novacetimonas hansenii]EFG83019.1 hypothetical protein GXY_15027 [Novacetimonas hansenii ATCC 23769]MBL7235925.1 hypothetical protein [Novacetimonas hansenii]MCJ8354948.1 hypothetical protein [Novacetimonas hansenii]PYD73363.1 hypothetical protein CFR74_04365 [Novacetimonas hansenii]QOF95657.1 hypothetical protein IFJ82_03040 [Novacetimonas hansenii]
MNLFGAAVAVVGAVGPGSAATLKLSTGSVGNADFTRTPQYRVVAATVWVQALSSDELAHVGDLSQQGALRVVYVAGDVGGMDRAAGTGGDIVNFDGADWLVVRQMEQWGTAWSKLMVRRQPQVT